MLSFYPAANTTGTIDGRQNYFGVQTEPKDYKGFVTKIDHNISEKHRVFGRANWSDFTTSKQTLPTIAVGTMTTRSNFSAVIDDVYVFNPQLLLNLRAGFTYFNPNTFPASRGFDITSLGLKSSLVSEISKYADPAGLAFPLIYIDEGAYAQLSDTGGNPQTRAYQTYQGTLTKITGNHSFRMGGDFRVFRESTGNFGNVAPRYEFSRTWTRGPAGYVSGGADRARTGLDAARPPDGRPCQRELIVVRTEHVRSAVLSGRLEADSEANDERRHSLGIRTTPTTERYNRSLRSFDFATASPVSAAVLANYAKSPIPEVPVSQWKTMGGLTFAGVGGQPRQLWQGDRTNFAPRIGLAYQLNQKTVLRSGYGIFFTQSGADRLSVNQGGFNQATNIIPSNDNGLNFRATLQNPFPDGIQPALGSSQGLNTFLGRAVSFFETKQRVPYMQRWSFSVQRSLGWQSLLEVQYVGNRGTGLGVSTNYNSIPRQYLSTSLVRDQATIDYLAQQVNSPFFGVPEFAGTGHASNRVGRNVLLKSYPQFGDVTNNQPAGMSWYHAMQGDVREAPLAWLHGSVVVHVVEIYGSDGVPERHGPGARARDLRPRFPAALYNQRHLGTAFRAWPCVWEQHEPLARHTGRRMAGAGLV